jgi:hypothetical protein
MHDIGKENKIRNYYSINEKEQTQSVAIIKIIWGFLDMSYS